MGWDDDGEPAKLAVPLELLLLQGGEGDEEELKQEQEKHP